MQDDQIKKLWHTNRKCFIEQFSILQTINSDGNFEHTYFEYNPKTQELERLSTCQIKEVRCTGLKDNTKWDNLSQKEKQDFYNEVCSENRETIKYKNVEYVKHLWKGKLIYEGDIVKAVQVIPTELIGKYTFEDDLFIVEYYNDFYGFRFKEDDCNYYYHIHDFAKFCTNEEADKGYLNEYKDIEIIGNIYENPELLKGLKND